MSVERFSVLWHCTRLKRTVKHHRNFEGEQVDYRALISVLSNLKSVALATRHYEKIAHLFLTCHMILGIFPVCWTSNMSKAIDMFNGKEWVWSLAKVLVSLVTPIIFLCVLLKESYKHYLLSGGIVSVCSVDVV